MKQTIRNQRLFFISLIGIVVVSLIMGTTFAYQTLEVENKDGAKTDVTINIGKLNVTFNLKCKNGETCDENNDNYDRINLSNMPLLKDYKTANYVEFTLNTNDTTDDVAYQINLKEIDYGYSVNGVKTSGCREATDTLHAACIISEDFKYTVVEINEYEERILSEGDFSDLTGTDYMLKLESGLYNSIQKGKKQKIRIYFWLQETNENQNSLENTYFKAKIEINSHFLTSLTSNFTEDILAYKILENAQNTTLEEEESLGYAYYRVKPATILAKEVSGEKESSLSMTLDNEGVSYYFRGNVKNNYVNFADMCWRIVRIEGDGSVKLILEDQYDTCEQDYDKDEDGKIFTGDWEIDLGNYGCEFTQESLEIMRFLLPVESKDKSMIKSLYNFQTDKLNSFLSQLKSGNWCLGDKSFTKEEVDNKYIYKPLHKPLEQYNSEESTYYDSNVRLSGSNNDFHSTFNCNGTIINEFENVTDVSDKTSMYVGAITVDEIIHAGGSYGKNNSNFYLINDYYKNISGFMLTLSPGYTENGRRDMIFYLMNNGYVLDDMHACSSYNLIRPVISLSNTSKYSGGNGTIENPYLVN